MERVTQAARLAAAPGTSGPEEVTLYKLSQSPHRKATLRARARQHRHSLTPSEQTLWNALRGKQQGAQFRRQVPLLGEYIVDFLASSARVVVEVDGGWHAERLRLDAQREARLARAGYRVVRVNAEEVLRELPVALARIRAALRS